MRHEEIIANGELLQVEVSPAEWQAAAAFAPVPSLEIVWSGRMSFAPVPTARDVLGSAGGMVAGACAMLVAVLATAAIFMI